MGIRLRIVLGFAILTIVVVSVVSFWAAQSLGFSLDISDLSKLENLRQQLINGLTAGQTTLDRLAGETATAFTDSRFLDNQPPVQQRQAEKIKSALGADWLEIFKDGRPLIFGQAAFIRPITNPGLPVRIASSGPFSYKGYMAAEIPLASDGLTLILARSPVQIANLPDFFCIFDQQGILMARGFNPEQVSLLSLSRENITHQLQVGDDLYRVRVFQEKNGVMLLTGYPAQRATLSRDLVDQLMLRLAVLEVIGLLILGFFLAVRLFAPLNALKHGMEQVAEGHWREIPLDKPPMQNSGNEIENVAKSFNRMVRELSLAQSRLIEVQKELAQKDKMAALGRFSAGIAHEINNPLGTILVTASMLKEAAAAGSSIPPEDFDAIIEEVRRCRDIISTLRTYTGRTQPQLSPTALGAFIGQIENFLKNEPAFKELTLSIEKPSDENLGLMIDSKAMQQVFSNLARNALEAMHDIDPKIMRISSEILQDHVKIRIQDHGRGFECLPEHIFEPLFTTKAQGTGLGLVICQAIIDGHHGKIEATRLEAGITEFCIQLPVAETLNRNTEE